ncbi:MAG: DEAD/DEAH box helicase, partial [Patescibacteria group bacterium]
TMPAKISQIGEMYMKKPLRIEIAPQGTTAERIDQEIFMVKKEDKIRLLETILDEYKGTILVFSRTKHGAKKIMNAVQHMNHTAAELHSNKSLAQRKLALAGFKSGRVRVLVATDIASRGIDVTNIELVVNFDIPEQTEDYVHRIGRTGRAGRSGKAISFVTPDQKNDLRMIERLIKSKLSISPLPNLPERRNIPEPPREHSHHGGSGRRDSRTFVGDRRSQNSRFDRRERPVNGGLQTGYSSTVGDNPARRAKQSAAPRLFTGAPTPQAPRGHGRFSNKSADKPHQQKPTHASKPKGEFQDRRPHNRGKFNRNKPA